jgi:hypothetical protein
VNKNILKELKKTQLFMMELIEELDDMKHIRGLRAQILELQNLIDEVESCL